MRFYLSSSRRSQHFFFYFLLVAIFLDVAAVPVPTTGTASTTAPPAFPECAAKVALKLGWDNDKRPTLFFGPLYGLLAGRDTEGHFRTYRAKFPYHGKGLQLLGATRNERNPSAYFSNEETLHSTLKIFEDLDELAEHGARQRGRWPFIVTSKDYFINMLRYMSELPSGCKDAQGVVHQKVIDAEVYENAKRFMKGLLRRSRT